MENPSLSHVTLDTDLPIIQPSVRRLLQFHAAVLGHLTHSIVLLCSVDLLCFLLGMQASRQGGQMDNCIPRSASILLSAIPATYCKVREVLGPTISPNSQCGVVMMAC